MEKENFLASGILEQYVMGLTTPDETEKVEEMAALYPEVNQKLCALQNCMDQYAEMNSLPSRKSPKNMPPGGISQGINSLSNWLKGLTTLFVIGLVAMCVFLYQGHQRYRSEIEGLNGQISYLQIQYLQLRENKKEIMEQYTLLKDASTRQVKLRGTQHAPQALALIYLNKNQRDCYMNIVNFPKAPEGNEYQIWANIGEEHVHLGRLTITDSMPALLHLPFIKGSKGFLITLEKEGEVENPSEDKMYAMGAMPVPNF